MVYIPLNENLLDHPKTQKACRRLGIAEVQLVGHLSALWLWCLSYAEDGDLSDYDPEEIAAGARWRDDPIAFVSALVECGRKGGAGFLESPTPGRLLVHDYDDYVGKLVDRRKANADRMRRGRQGETPPERPAAAPPQAAFLVLPDVPTHEHGTKTTVRDTCNAHVDSVRDTCGARVEPDKTNKDKTNKDKQIQEKQREDNNNKEERSGEETGGLPPLPVAHADPDCQEGVVALLTNLGVSESMAEDLVRRRTCDQIHQQVDSLPFRIREKATSPRPVRDAAALLVKAIEDGYAVPPSRVQAVQAEADAARAADESAEASRRALTRTEEQQAERHAVRMRRSALDAAFAALAEDPVALEEFEEQVKVAALTTKFNRDSWQAHGKIQETVLRPIRDALLAERGLVEK